MSLPRVDLLFRGGVVLTGDPAAPRARAAAVRDGVVVALDEDALALGGAAGEVFDLEGGALMAGFGDGHVHPLWGGVELAGPQVRDCAAVTEVVEVVRRFAAEHRDLPWIVGGPYDPALAPSGLFDAAWLDAAVADRPVVLQSTDHHCAWVNSEALRRGGLDAATPDPPAGRIARRPDGSPLGTLVEWSAMDLVLRHAPPPTPADKERGLRAATALLAAAGVTWAQEAALSPGDVDVYRSVAEAGELAVRAGIALRAEPGEWPRQRADFLAARASLEGSPDVSARTVKLFADGVVEAGTAALLAPYADAPHTCGLPVWAPEELAEAAVAFDADGFQLHVHAIGDAGIRAALDAVEHVRAVNGLRDRRPVIAHTQLVHPDDLPRFAALEVVANVEPLWAQLDPVQTELTLPRLGPARGRLQYPMASLLASGAVLSMGSDWPVSSHRPLDGLAVAVTRQTPDGRPPEGWLPEQRLPPAAALAAYTVGSAYQAFEDLSRGTVTVGRRADLVWLGSDPYAVPPADWPEIPVRGTWLGGRPTWGPGAGPAPSR
ncbi:MAG TPA: amidohydrolase [Actinomycetes bacterium]